MNLSNKITMFRIALVPPIVFFMLYTNMSHRYLYAFILFLIASFTDYLDGKVAKKYNQTTVFGMFADPIADKILIISVFLCFIELRMIGTLAVILMVIREFVVIFVRLIASYKGKVISANIFGKLKTVSQMLLIVFIFIVKIPSTNNFNINAIAYLMLNMVDASLQFFTVCITIISGIIYVHANMDILKSSE